MPLKRLKVVSDEFKSKNNILIPHHSILQGGSAQSHPTKKEDKGLTQQ